MKVKVGDIIASEFGVGKIIVITKKWIIHEIDSGKDECAIPHDKWNEMWIPVEKIDFDIVDE